MSRTRIREAMVAANGQCEEQHDECGRYGRFGCCAGRHGIGQSCGNSAHHSEHSSHGHLWQFGRDYIRILNRG
jgi:hypothetical protein